MKALQGSSQIQHKNSPQKDELTSVDLQCLDHQQCCVLLTQDSPTARSLEVLGSHVFSERKLSAFSIYSPESFEHHVSIDDNQQRESQSQFPLKQYSPRIKQSKIKSKRQKEKSETKNLNRYFRSKINQMLRQIRDNHTSSAQDKQKSSSLLDNLNKTNKIMFGQIRQILQDTWLQQQFSKCRSILLKYIHKGKMGMQSKLLMMKYFNKILMAIDNPEQFQCWK